MRSTFSPAPTPLIRLVFTALLLVAVTFASPATAQPAFEDVPPSHPFAFDIAWLAETGITQGCSATAFCPDDMVTRGQVAALLHRAYNFWAGDSQPVGSPAPFTDVSTGNIFNADIAWLSAQGITKGCNPPNNTAFCPNAAVTRGQIAAFLNRLFGLDSAVHASFTDVPGTHLFANDIAALAASGITRGCGPTTFCPDEPVTRAQLAAFLHRADQLSATYFDTDETPEDPPDDTIPLVLETAALPGSTVGAEYATSLNATGGEGAYSWSLLSAPDWLDVDPATGELSGLASTAGDHYVEVEVRDTASSVATAVLSLDVSPAPGCEDNASLSDLECLALSSLEDSSNLGDFGWAAGGDPCDWPGVECVGGKLRWLNFGEIASDFSAGDLTLALPPEIKYLADLRFLDISSQTVSAPLPSEIGQLPRLQRLRIRHAQLPGTIPTEIGQLATLGTLELWDNNLTGTIPTSLGQLAALTTLSLDQNYLTGVVPDVFGAMEDLVFLALARNELSGELPRSMMDGPASLLFVDLHGNGCFTATDPDFATWLDGHAFFWDDGC